MSTELLKELKDRGEQVTKYLLDFSGFQKLQPQHLRDGVEHYIRQGGKRLRPALLLWACELVGGASAKALPAAAAIELSHTWTLVHDDIIDKDDLRRGAPSMHAYYQKYFQEKYPNQEVEHLSKSFAILVGDTQQSLAINMLNQTQADSNVVKWLIDDLTSNWVPEVVNGEILDIEFAWQSLSELSEAEILKMLAAKTSSTFVWSVRAGAIIGLNKVDLDNKIIKALEEIAYQAGLAFQLQDDILGILGDEKDLGKPIGSDIREGKRTIIATHAYKTGTDTDREFLDRVLGNEQATEQDITLVKELFKRLGSIDYVKSLVKQSSNLAIAKLNDLPIHPIKSYFKEWIEFIGNRNF